MSETSGNSARSENGLSERSNRENESRPRGDPEPRDGAEPVWCGEFYQAPTVEFENSAGTVSSCLFGFLAPGTHLCVHDRFALGASVNLLLVLAFFLTSLLSVYTGIFPVPVFITVGMLFVSAWIYNIIRVFRQTRRMFAPAEIWGHVGFAILTFWIPFSICFFVSENFVLQRTWMGNDTMRPGMEKGDIVLVNRLAYHMTEPAYGDLVLVEERSQESGVLHRRSFFGRIIALPGDKVQLNGFHPSVNGKSLRQYFARLEQYILDRSIVVYELPSGYEVDGEPLPEPEKWYPVLASNQLLFAQTNVVTLEPEYYYILEDNRDSGRERARTSFGSIVHRSEIRGRPQFVLINTLAEHRFSRCGIVLR